ncbi:hypothetical protein O6H91_10G002600 [Diphasiastrum complanatum]|uniref:Uncharacterized protein n=1 Tax=Diphasiastrum complanatum TaxID=34168 RepID=A0ACC2CDM4_DIPCM|nr:hypothetical protein O6H91_10G002600 [Diphasiastrum complanatum]
MAVFVASGTASCIGGKSATCNILSDGLVCSSACVDVMLQPTDRFFGRVGLTKTERSRLVVEPGLRSEHWFSRVVHGSTKRGGNLLFAGAAGNSNSGDASTSASDTMQDLCSHENKGSESLEVPRAPKLLDVYQAWELLRQDVMYLDWRAKQDIWAIKTAHDKVVEVLNPLAREHKSVETLRQELAHLKDELARAHNQVHLSEARVEHTLHRLVEMESFVSDRLLQLSYPLKNHVENATGLKGGHPQASQFAKTENKSLVVSGPIGSYSAHLKNFWYPVAFSKSINTETALAFESFEEKWVIFRGKDGKAGCIRDACAHRACPLSLGKVMDGCIQCPYHGWEYSTTGICEKMPSTRQINASVRSIPCIEKDGLVWIWPGNKIPEATLPAALSPPEGYTIHAEIVLELSVEHSLLMENLLDLAHAPFTHTTTFAKGWPVPSSVRFKTPMEALRGFWDPYPIDMEFRPPCMVLSTIGIALPGQLKGKSTSDCETHLHQLHVCVPSSKGKTQLLYRLSLDFGEWLIHVPFIENLWKHLAGKVLAEDLRLVEGQQDRMIRGENVWNLPVAYDKLGVRYRRWRIAVEDSNSQQ